MSQRNEMEAMGLGQLDVSMVIEMLAEPMYLSEIARKLQDINPPIGLNRDELEELDSIGSTWGDISLLNAINKVSWIVSRLAEEGALEASRIPYDEDDDSEFGESQQKGSMKIGFDRAKKELGPIKTWNLYHLVHSPASEASDVGSALREVGEEELARRFEERVNPEVTFAEKAEMVKNISRIGNNQSRIAEQIMQSVMERQFREYERTRTPDYNDPGVDFMVVDEDRRNYGLLVEVSVRWENPIGEPYIESKKEEQMELEEEEGNPAFDLLILAPKFSGVQKQKYENPDNPAWHSDPLESMIHLHNVPFQEPEVWRPFATSESELPEEEDLGGGSPVIVPDSSKLQDRIEEAGLVSENYPVVEDFPDGFVAALDYLRRDSQIVTESRYRSMLREAIEPLLWEFMRPYKIEQFLLDMYWDRGLTQSEIGKLVGRSGSTIGSWMRKFGVMRRGTGAPELSDETIEIWKRMYRGEEPFPAQFSGYRIQAEYNRHPLWSLDQWREWYAETSEEERKSVIRQQDSFRDNMDYTVMVGAMDRLQPSYSFILKTLRENGVEIREPDEAPRVPYSAYPSKEALEYMLNRDGNTIVDVSDGGGE